MLRKKIFLNSFSSIILLVLNFFVKIYLSYYYTPQELTSFATLADILMTAGFVQAGLKDALVRHSSKTDQAEELVPLYSLGFAIFLLVTVPFVLRAVTQTGLSQLLLNLDVSLSLFMGWYLILTTKMYLSYLLLSSTKNTFIAFQELIERVVYLALFFGIIFMARAKCPISYMAYATIAASLVSLLITLQQSVELFQNVTWASFRALVHRRQEIVTFLKHSGIASLEYVAASTLLYGTSFVLFMNYPQKQLADFQVVARPIYTAAISTFSYPVFRFAFPEFSRLVREKSFSLIISYEKKAQKLLILMLIAIAIACALLVKPFIARIFPPIYEQSYKATIVLMLGLPFVIYTAFLFAVIKSTASFFYSLYVRLFGALILGVSILGFHAIGFDQDFQIPLAILLSTVSMCVLSKVFSQKALNALVANHFETTVR